MPAVIVLGFITFGYHLFAGAAISDAMLASLAVLIVSCPCALGLATPLAIASGIRNSLANNIIFKTASVFEEKDEAETIAFDKTGTLTTGNMQLLDRGNHNKALQLAALVEQFSSHPIAEPIAAAYSDQDMAITNFESSSRGVTGFVDDKTIYVGQPEWVHQKELTISKPQQHKVEQSRSMGHVPVAVGWEGQIRSILVVGDQLRSEAPQIISALQESGKNVAIITGDSREAGEAIQQKLNPDFLFTETRPDSKSNIINELRKFGRVAMIGDGSNDAPALAQADLGVAFGNPTAIAAESAHVVIPRDRLTLIPSAFKAIKQTKNHIRQNLGWAFLYNIITIPLAIAGAINPLFAAVAMATSSLLVVGNSSRNMNLESE